MPSMIAASPNWRSRSSRSVRLPSNLAKAAARLVEVTVFPVPPLGENTVTMRPRRAGVPAGGRCPGRPALRIAKTTFSVICGRSRTSETSASSASSSRAEDSPEASRMMGARVCSRIAASSSSGKAELRVPWRTTWRWPPVSVGADSRTPALEPTSSTSPCRSRASLSCSRPSHDPVTKIRTFSRVATEVSTLIELPFDAVVEALDLLGPETVGEDRLPVLGAFGAVGRIGGRPEDERPRAVLGHPEELLLLGVRDGELGGERPVRGTLGDRARGVGQVGALEDEADAVLGALGHGPGADDVDPVARLERPGEKLMGAAGQLDGAEIAGQLC